MSESPGWKIDGNILAIKPIVDRDGRHFIPMIWAVECPAIVDFINRFSNYYKPSVDRDGWEGPKPPPSEPD